MDIQLILEFKITFGKYCQVFPKKTLKGVFFGHSIYFIVTHILHITKSAFQVQLTQVWSRKPMFKIGSEHFRKDKKIFSFYVKKGWLAQIGEQNFRFSNGQSFLCIIDNTTKYIAIISCSKGKTKLCSPKTKTYLL